MNRFASSKDQPSQPESSSASMNPITRDTRKQWTKLRPNMTSWLIIARRFRDELSSSVISKPPSVVEKRKKILLRPDGGGGILRGAKGIPRRFYSNWWQTLAEQRGRGGGKKRGNGCCHRSAAISRSTASGSWKRVHSRRERFFPTAWKNQPPPVA